MAEISTSGWKTQSEKEKLLDTSNFSFSHSVFKRLVLPTCKKQGLFGKGLNFNSLGKELKFSLADNKSVVALMMISVYHGIEKIVGKGENAGYQHFLLFPQHFQKASFSGSFKVRIVW